ncbi:MAG TPA: SMP-30/gluconolactonase/LRE family protein [Acidimicrobiales bacterium]
MATTATTLIDGLHFPEGPRWHDGRLWFSDFHAYAVKAVGLDGEVEIMATVPGQPSGLGWLPDGRLLVVSMIDRKLMRQEQDGTLVEHADLSELAPFHCNDMVVDAQGRAYVGNFGFDLEGFIAEHGLAAALAEPGVPRTVLMRVDPDGAVHVAADGLQFPNGTVITPDGKTLIVAETFGLCLTAFDIVDDGSLHHRRVWADLGFHAPDGICLDADGNIWVANPTTPEAVLYAPGGAAIDKVETSQPCYACMLGGDDGKTLFCLTARTSDSSVTSVERTGKVETAVVSVPHAGLP